MKTLKLSKASRPLAEYAAELGGEVVILTDGTKAVAAIVPLKNVDRDAIVLSGHPEFLKIIARSRAQFRRGQTMSLTEVKEAFQLGRSPNRRVQPAASPRRGRGTRKLVRRRTRG